MTTKKKTTKKAAPKKRMSAAAKQKLKYTNMARNMQKLDSWYSAMTGAGQTGYDKFTDYTFRRSSKGDDTAELENMYIASDLAAVVVDRVVDDAMRQGFELKSSDPDFDAGTMHEIVKWAEDQYGLTETVVEARKWSRLYGGAGVFVGADGDQASPIKLGAKVHFLRAHGKPELTTHKWYNDPLKKNFGKPAMYKLLGNVVGAAVEDKVTQSTKPETLIDVHESRVPMFQGVKTTRRHFNERAGFGDSVLRRPYDVLVRFDGSWQSMMNLLVDASQGVYKVDGFLELLASNNFDLLVERLALIDRTKSSYRAIILDAENESYDRVRTPLQEIADILDRAMSRLAAATQTPVTILFGQSPAGLNATGESDTRNWYDVVRKEQTLVFTPRLKDLFTILLSQPDSPTNGVVPEDLDVVFPSIWQNTPRQEAEIYSMTSAADAANVTAQIYTPEQVAKARQSGANAWGQPTVNLTEDVVSVIDEDIDLLEAPEGPTEEATPEVGSPEGLDIPEGAEPQKAALNGAQVTSLVAIVSQAIAGDLPLTTAKELIMASFPISPEGADAILADVPDKFEEKQNEPEPTPPVIGPNGEVLAPGEPAEGDGEQPEADAPVAPGTGIPEVQPPTDK